MRLIQQHGEFAEHGLGLRHPGDLKPFLNDCDRALLKDQQPAGCRGCAEHALAGLVVVSNASIERPRRYCFHFDEVAEAEAQGLPTCSYPGF
jgi:hypothetical protein